MEFIKMLLGSSVVWKLLALATLLTWALVIEWAVLHLLNNYEWRINNYEWRIKNYEWRIKQELRRFPWHGRGFLIKCLRKLGSLASMAERRINHLIRSLETGD